MQLGMLGLGRMGANMVRRLLKTGHQAVVYDRLASAVRTLSGEGATGSDSLRDFIGRLQKPRVVWLMIPAGVVDQTLDELTPLLEAGDIVIDGGNSWYRDDLVRAKRLGEKAIHYVDCGTSGGVFGLERGYCLMIGGEPHVVRRLEPIFASLAPGEDGKSVGNNGTARLGYLHCGPNGAGHFVKMVHNGIEYGLMAAYAEGLNILKHANVGSKEVAADAETTPLRDPAAYRYDLDLAQIVELWRHGSVISSWLLDLTANALRDDADLSEFAGRVSDSGEGRWTLTAAIDEGVPAPVLSAALFERFQSRGNAEYAGRVLSAMRKQFGGHEERK